MKYVLLLHPDSVFEKDLETGVLTYPRIEPIINGEVMPISRIVIVPKDGLEMFTVLVKSDDLTDSEFWDKDMAYLIPDVANLPLTFSRKPEK